MQKLSGHWVAKRTGILEHYKSMAPAEIVLFDAYLLLANKQTWECWRTIRQLQDILPMKRNTIIKAKKALIDRGWIQQIGRSGVFIPKLFRYAQDEDKVQNMDPMVQNINSSSPPQIGPRVQNMDLMVQNINHPVQNMDPMVRFGIPIIEEGIIIEDDYLLRRSEKSEMDGLCKPAPADLRLSEQERLLLGLLKSIPGYPFDFERDLAFIRDLLVDFPALDLEQEIKDWKVWLLDKNLKGKINYRSRLRKWLKKTIAYGKEREHAVRTGSSEQKDADPARPVCPTGRGGRKGFDLPSDYPIDVGPGKNR